MATYSNLFIDQGSNFNATIDLSQTTGSLDLTDYVSAGTIAKSYNGTSKGSFTVSVDDTNGELDISLSAAETAALKPGRYVYDVIIKSPAGVITRVLEGQLEVTPGVTFDATAPETTLGAGNISSSESGSSSSSSSTTTKSVFTKSFVPTTGSMGTTGTINNPHSDAYAFIELDQNISHTSTGAPDYDPTSSITVSLDFAHTKGAAYSNVFLFLTNNTGVDNWVKWEDDEFNQNTAIDGYYTNQELTGTGVRTITLTIPSLEQAAGAFKYLGIVLEDAAPGNQSYSELEAQFEISNLEIKNSSNPGGGDVKFLTPKRVYNANETTSSSHGDPDTEFKFDSISSPTGLFKS